MKKTIKYSFALLAGVLMLGACCKDKLIAQQDTYAGYKGETGKFAYIVGATMPMYDALTTSVKHTPLGEYGVVSKTFTIGLTEVQSSDVTVTIGLDSDAVGSSYTPVPEELFVYDKNVTIPAGKDTASVTVSIPKDKLPKLTESSYEAIFKILSVSGGNLSVSSNSNQSLIFINTETINPANNIVTVTGSTTEYTVKIYTDGVMGDNVSKEITVNGSEAAFSEFEVVMAVDNSLIDSYNNTNGTSYVAVPDGLVSITNAIMAEGATSATATVSIADDDRAQLTDENGYLIPVVIEDASPATKGENSGVTYIVVKVVKFDSASNQFSALYLGDYNMATWYEFNNTIDLSGGFTIAFSFFIDEKTTYARIFDFTDASGTYLDGNWINMLRFGQKGGTELEWWVGPGSCRKKLYSDQFSIGQWYMLMLCFDASTGVYTMYVNGQSVASETLSEDELATVNESPFKFKAIEFNSSWGSGYRKGNEFHGRVAYLSIWDWDFMSNYNWLYSYIKGDISQSGNFQYFVGTTYGYDLMAFWPMTEGTGSILNEATGLYESIDFSKSKRCDDEQTTNPADVSAYVQWKADEHNTEDSYYSDLEK